MVFIWPEAKLFFAVVPVILIILHAIFARCPSANSTTYKILEYNILHLVLTCILFNLSTWILIDWFRLHKHLQPLSGFIYCPYELASAEVHLCALGIVKFEFFKQMEMLLVGCSGVWASLWEARTVMQRPSVRPCAFLPTFMPRLSVLTYLQCDQFALRSFLKQPFFYASSLTLWATAKAWWDIRDVARGTGWTLSRTYFAGDARNHYQASDNTQVKRCVPEAGACHVLRWHGLDGRSYPTIDLACQEAVSVNLLAKKKEG